jgi:hypothetical protein
LGKEESFPNRDDFLGEAVIKAIHTSTRIIETLVVMMTVVDSWKSVWNESRTGNSVRGGQ